MPEYILSQWHKYVSIIIPSAVFMLLIFALKQAYSLSSVGLNRPCTYYSINYWSLLCQSFINNWFRCSLLIFLSLCKCSQTLHPFFSCAYSITTRSSSASHIVCSKNIWWVKGITTSFQFLTMEFQNFSKTLFFKVMHCLL